MHRPPIEYLIAILPETDREFLSGRLSCGLSPKEIADAIVNSPEGRDATSGTLLESNDLFWQLLVQTTYPSFHARIRASYLPSPEKSDFRGTSAWKDLYTELVALHSNEVARNTLEVALFRKEQLNIEPLLGYELVTHVLCMRELAPAESLIAGTSVVSECIRLASSVCLNLELQSDEKWKLLLSSLVQGKLAVFQRLTEDKELSSLHKPDSPKWKEVFIAAARSRRKGAQKLALSYIPTDDAGITSFLRCLFGQSAKQVTDVGLFIPSAGQPKRPLEHLDTIRHPIDVINAVIDDGRANVAVYNNFLLGWASARGEVGLVSLLLLDSRVDRSQNGGVTLYHAVSSGKTAVVRVLLSHPGVKKKVRDETLCRAIEHNKSSLAVKLLLADDVDSQCLALGLCAYYDRRELLDELLGDAQAMKGVVHAGPWMHKLFLWKSGIHIDCTKRIITALSLDLKKEECILTSLVQSFGTSGLEVPEKGEAMRCLLAELGSVSTAERASAIRSACDMNYLDVLVVLLEHEAPKEGETPHALFAECMDGAVGTRSLDIVRGLLLAFLPTSEELTRWIVSSCLSLSRSATKILELLLAHYKGGNLPSATTSCAGVLLARRDFVRLGVFMDCSHFDPGAGGSFLMQIALSDNNPIAVSSLLRDSRSTAGLDKASVDMLFLRLLDLNNRIILEDAVLQDGMEECRIGGDTLERTTKRLGWWSRSSTRETMRATFNEKRKEFRRDREQKRK